MRVALPDWTVLALFTATVLCVTLYGLALSAHFPEEHRRPSLKGPVGNLVIWGSMAIALLAAAVAVRLALASLPGYAAVIAGGIAILIAPILLKPLPDELIDDRAGLLLFAALSGLLAAISTVA